MFDDYCFTSLPLELLNIIANYISDGLTWKSFIFTCSQFNYFNTDAKVDMFSNHLATLVHLYPNKRWNMHRISSDPRIDTNFVINHPSFIWNYKSLASNKSVELDKLIKDTSMLSLDYLSRSVNLKWCIVVSMTDCWWNWDVLLQNNNISASNILSLPRWREFYVYVASKTDFTVDMLFAYPSKYHKIMLDHGSSSPMITYNDVLKYPQLPWCWVGLTMNKNITWDEIEVNLPNIMQNISWSCLSEHLRTGSSGRYDSFIDIVKHHNDLPWNWKCLSMNKSLTIKILSDNLDLPWEWRIISGKNIIKTQDGINFVISNHHLDWNWYLISKVVTWDVVIKYDFIDWDYDALALNPNTTVEIIKDKFGLFLCYNHSSHNPNLTWRFVKDHMLEKFIGAW